MKRSQALYRFELATAGNHSPRLVLCLYDLSDLPGQTFPAKTVTNAAEDVVDELVERGFLKPDMRIIYRDTRRVWDEIQIKDGRFAGFAPLNVIERDDALRLLAQETASDE